MSTLYDGMLALSNRKCCFIIVSLCDSVFTLTIVSPMLIITSIALTVGRSVAEIVVVVLDSQLLLSKCCNLYSI